MLSIDPNKTAVILIGISQFTKDSEHLPDLPAVKNNVNDLAQIFADENIIGIPAENIHVILDEGIPTRILK